MAKTATLTYPTTPWQNQVQPSSNTTTSGQPPFNNNVEVTSSGEEDMLQKLVTNRARGQRKSSNIDTSSTASRFNARSVQRGSRTSLHRDSPRLQPIGNQSVIVPEDSKRSTSSLTSAQDDDDGKDSATVQLPPATSASISTSYPGSTAIKEQARRDMTEKLDSLTICARTPSTSTPSIVVLGKMHSSKGIVGLQNLGNTCFMNSCLQCLNNVDCIMKYFRGNSHLNELNQGSPTQGKLACVFGDLAQSLWNGAEFTSTRPVELKRIVGKLASRFLGYDQHDAQEFLRFLLDGLHEDLNRILKKPAYYEIPDRPTAKEHEVSDEYWQNYVNRNTSTLSEQFCGQLRSEVTCQTCSHRSICFDVFWDLSLPVPKKPKTSAIRFGVHKSNEEDSTMCTIQDCLRAYTEEEHMKEEDAFYCSKCKTHRSVVKKISLQRCPNVLVLHLKRFSYSTFSREKVSTAVKIHTEGLDVKEFCSKDNIYYDKSWEYDLIGIIHHMGSLNGGHYTAECRNPENGNWYDFNDETVSALKKPHSSSPSAYILFYQRRHH